MSYKVEVRIYKLGKYTPGEERRLDAYSKRVAQNIEDKLNRASKEAVENLIDLTLEASYDAL